MSYIDTFDHEFLGYFGGIPLYRPLAEVQGSLDAYDFGCSPEHLVLGGGSGEHPAIIVSELRAPVAHFLSHWMLARTPEEDGAMEEVGKLIQDAGGDVGEWNRILDPLLHRPWGEFLHFAGWGADDYHAFGGHCRSAAFHTPFAPGEGALENWLAASLGEFAFFSLPEMVDIAHLPGARTVVRPVYGNVLIPPPGYPTLGRQTRDGRVIWGHSRWTPG